MPAPVLTQDERSHIEAGSWFSKLSPALREAILARSVVRRLPDATELGSRGASADQWCGEIGRASCRERV